MKRYLVYLCSLALILTMLTDGNYTYHAAAASVDDAAFGRFLQREYVFNEEELQWIDEAKEALLRELRSGVTILVKASRSMAFERIVDFLLENIDD